MKISHISVLQGYHLHKYTRRAIQYDHSERDAASFLVVIKVAFSCYNTNVVLMLLDVIDMLGKSQAMP